MAAAVVVEADIRRKARAAADMAAGMVDMTPRHTQTERLRG